MSNQKGKMVLGGIEKDAVKIYFQEKRKSKLQKLLGFHFCFLGLLLLFSYLIGDYNLLLLGVIFSTITITADSATQFESGGAEYNDVARLDDNTFVIAFRDIDDNNKGKAIIGTRSGTTVSIVEDSAIVFEEGETNQINICSLDSTHFVISYKDVSETKIKAIAGSVSGTTITLGSIVEIGVDGTYAGDICALNNSNVVILYSESSSTNCKVCSISGITITVGNAQQIVENYSVNWRLSIGMLTSTKIVCSYSDGNTESVIIGTVDIGVKTISYGVSLSLDSYYYDMTLAVFDENYFIVAADDNNIANVVICCNVSGTTITKGSEVGINSDDASPDYLSICTMDTTHFVVCYPQKDNLNKGTIRGGSIAGTTITLDDDGEVVFENDVTTYPKICKLTENYFIIPFKHG